MESPEISNEAVQAKTGKNWDEWFAILDAAGGKEMRHKEIVAVLSKNYEIDPWWQQSVTVAYEKARGLRQKHEMVDGYQISKSITIHAPVEKVFSAWTDKPARGQWLGNTDFSIRKTTPNKSIRIAWKDPQSNIEVYFYPKGERVQVTLNHSKLPDQSQAEKMKAYWTNQFEKMKVYLEN
jgi:uncharacterized protein YndB with AHSA1/START domain